MNSQVRKVNGFHLATLALLCTAFTPPAWALITRKGQEMRENRMRVNKWTGLAAALGLLSAASTPLWAETGAGLGNGIATANSPHNFATGSVGGIINDSGEICRVCHVPHDHARQRYLNGLLWNHEVSSQSYSMYSNTWSKTLTGTQSAQPDGHSKLCLGCHDGTVAMDTFDKYVGDGSNTMRNLHGLSIIGWFTDGANIDLRGTHPISIAFPAGETGDGKNFTDPTTATWSRGQTVAATLDNGKVQCSTCHDVHDQESVPGTHLLRTAQTTVEGGVPSGLCLTCHVK